MNSQDAVNDYSQQSLFTKIMTRCLHFYIGASRYAGYLVASSLFIRFRVPKSVGCFCRLFSEATYRIEGRSVTIFLTLVIGGCQNPGIEVQR